MSRSFDNDLTEIVQHLENIPENQNSATTQFFNYPVFSNLILNKLEGKHVFGKVTLQWNLSHTLVQRERKDGAFSEMYKPLRDDSLFYFLHEHPELKKVYPASSGWYNNKERGFHFFAVASLPVLRGKEKGNLSLGYSATYKYIRYDFQELSLRYRNNTATDNFSSHVYHTYAG